MLLLSRLQIHPNPMPPGNGEIDARIADWWKWFTMALFLLVPVDLVSTLVAIAKYGAGVEANPIMEWLLAQGLAPVVVVNLVVVGLAVLLFDTAIDAVRTAPASYRTQLVFGFNLWIGFVFAAGVVLTANNVLVIA